MREVQNKWSTLKMNDDIWAKLIYFEGNRRLAKAYVSAPMLTVDGSTNGLDGFRIGLSGIENSYRSLESIACLRGIGQGVKLRIDSQGNILVRKMGSGLGPSQCSVWIKEWPAKSSNLDNWTMRELDQLDTSYKLFDMHKFRLQLERRRLLQERHGADELEVAENDDDELDDNLFDWRQCVSLISFVRTSADQTTPKQGPQRILRDPCWLMLINIIAIDMLKSSTCDTRRQETKVRHLDSYHQAPESGVSRLAGPDYAGALANHHPHEEPIRAMRANKSSGNSNRLSGNSNRFDRRRAPSPMMRPSSSVASLYPSNGRQPLGRLSTNPQLLQGCEPKSLAGGRQGRLGSPMMISSNLNRQRRYQSTQQLANTSSASSSSSNNAIYTTFTGGKYLAASNPRRRQQQQHCGADYPSTTDHNSRNSTGDDRGPRPNYNHLYPVDGSPYQRPSRARWNFNEQMLGRIPFARQTILALASDSNSKGHSQSAFDLVHGHKLDLRSMKSTSIKMNFNDESEAEGPLTEQDELDDHRPRQVAMAGETQFPVQKVGLSSRRAILALNKEAVNWSQLKNHKFSQNSLNISDSNASKSTSSSSSSSFETGLDGGAVGAGASVPDEGSDLNPQSHSENRAEQQAPKEQKGKLMRSSTGSTSSSSGCADNDYFLTHSSSSMSSSTQSNELFSQPASSSGIICSGSTSDEYDDARKPSESQVSGPMKITSTKKPISHSTQAIKKTFGERRSRSRQEQGGNDAKGEQRKSTTRKQIRSISRNRCYNIKTIGPPEDGPPAMACDHYDDNQEPCDCLANGAEELCDCCCQCDDCQPPVGPAEGTTATGVCDCDTGPPEESIYDRLPRPEQLAPGKPTARPSASRHELATLSDVHEDWDNITPMPPDGSAKAKRSTTKDLPKQSVSWLESRKYIKLFPKFMFSSSPNHNNNKHAQAINKSGTLDGRSGQSKFRRTRSSQNLS